MDPRGFIQIKDRSKDVIKSGGEWISSVELENKIMGHPAVAEAAVIAIPDPKWAERPLAVVVLKQGESVTDEQLKEFLSGQCAKWWVPDRFEFIDEIPKTRGRQVPQDGAARPVRGRGRGGAGLDVRAILLRETGGPVRLELADVPDRSRADGQVMLHVRAAGINFADVLVRQGRYPQAPPLPTVLGSEVAGEVDGRPRDRDAVRAGGYGERVVVDRAPRSCRCPTRRASRKVRRSC